MLGKKKAVFGIFKNRDDIEAAINALKYAGFNITAISVLSPENAGIRTFAHEKDSKAPEGAAAGASTGALLGGTLGWLVGIGSLAIPGVGPFIAAGPIVAALAGVGVGSVLGGASGALIGLGIPEYEAKRYETYFNEGGILLSVHCNDSDEIKRATELLKETGAHDIASSSEAVPPQPRKEANHPERKAANY